MNRGWCSFGGCDGVAAQDDRQANAVQTAGEQTGVSSWQGTGGLAGLCLGVAARP